MTEYRNFTDAKEHQKHFAIHLNAMTGESLHGKFEIAHELAHRDQQIESLQAKVAALPPVLRELSDEELRTAWDEAFALCDNLTPHETVIFCFRAIIKAAREAA